MTTRDAQRPGRSGLLCLHACRAGRAVTVTPTVNSEPALARALSNGSSMLAIGEDASERLNPQEFSHIWPSRARARAGASANGSRDQVHFAFKPAKNKSDLLAEGDRE